MHFDSQTDNAQKGATTLSITALRRTTCGITAFGITTLRLIGLLVTLSITAFGKTLSKRHSE